MKIIFQEFLAKDMDVERGKATEGNGKHKFHAKTRLEYWLHQIWYIMVIIIYKANSKTAKDGFKCADKKRGRVNFLMRTHLIWPLVANVLIYLAEIQYPKGPEILTLLLLCGLALLISVVCNKLDWHQKVIDCLVYLVKWRERNKIKCCHMGGLDNMISSRHT